MHQTLVLNVAQKTGREGARRNARNLAIVLVASILLLVGCTGGASLEGTQWVLVTLEGEPPGLRLRTRRVQVQLLPRVLEPTRLGVGLSLSQRGKRHGLPAGRGTALALPHRSIQWAAHGQTVAIEDVGVDHGGLDVFVDKEFLDGADVATVFEQVRGKNA